MVCWDCKRIGVYSRRRFAQLVGAETCLPDAKAVIAADVCKKAAGKDALLFDRCRIRYYRPDPGDFEHRDG